MEAKLTLWGLTVWNFMVLIIGMITGAFLTKKASIWLDSVRTLNVISLLRKDIEKKDIEIKSLHVEVEELKRRNNLLEEQVGYLETHLTERQTTIEELMTRLKDQTAQMNELVEQMAHFQIGKNDFERRLLKFLTMKFSIGPEDIAKELGIDIYES